MVTPEGEVPVIAASVTVMGLDWPGNIVIATTVTTDQNGRFSIPEVRMPDGALWLLVGASKPGYFADFIYWMEFPQPAKIDLRLDRWVHIPLGEMIQGSIGAALCAGNGYGGWYGRTPCERFAVTVPQSGTLDVTLSGPVADFVLDLVKPDGTFAGVAFQNSPGSPLRLTVPVEAGSTYEIRVSADGPGTKFELMTGLR